MLEERIAAHKAVIGVIGCGYVGLPLAMSFSGAGFRVIGFDVDTSKVAALQRGESYIGDIPSDIVARATAAGTFRPTTDFDALAECDVVFVSVPTPFDRAKQPDLSYVTSAAKDIARRLRRGQLIILESTTYPGTTDEVLRPILEAGGLRAGHDFWLAFSPERIDPGNRRYGIANTPKVVGGVDSESTRLARLTLEQVVSSGTVHAVSSARAAELTKLLENTFRAVNIALVNELTMLCDRMGIDIWEVIDAAATKPFGFVPFYPGPGVGGHCIPVDPYYLSWKAREFDFHTKFIELAAEVNLEMPFFAASRVQRRLNADGLALKGASVLCLGAAFKGDIEDARNSAAIRVMEILAAEGATVSYHDPHVARIRLAPDLYHGGHEAPGRELSSVPLTQETVRRADIVAILVPHSSVDYKMVLGSAARVFDAVNATRGIATDAIIERL